jgi:hypothetical protein
VKSRKLFLGSSRRSSVEFPSGGKIHRCGRDRSGAQWPELVALRAIVLNVLFKQANAQTLTAEEMQQLIDRAD